MAIEGLYLDYKNEIRIYSLVESIQYTYVRTQGARYWYVNSSYGVNIYGSIGTNIPFVNPIDLPVSSGASYEIGGWILQFKRCWYIYVKTSVASGSGTVSAINELLISGLDSRSVTATPANNWKVSSWSIPGNGSNNTITVWPTGTSDINVQVTFTRIKWTISLNTDGNGTVGIDGSNPKATASKVVNQGDACTLTAIANKHYEFKRWHSTIPSEYESTRNPLIWGPYANRVWTAEFVINEWEVSVSSEGDGSAIIGLAGEDTSKFFKNEGTVTVLATPAHSTRNVFVHWKNTEGAVLSEDNQYSFIMEPSPIHIIAVFKNKVYEIAAEYKNYDENETDVWGTVSLRANSANQTTTDEILSVSDTHFWAENPVVLTAIPKTHATFVKWKDQDGVEYTTAQLVLSYSDYTSRTYTAYFEQSALYTITLDPDGIDANGNKLELLSHEGMGTGDDSDKYYGGYIEVQATPSVGQMLKQWNATGKQSIVDGQPGFDSVWRILLDVDMTVKADFGLNEYDVIWDVDAPSAGHGTITASGVTAPPFFYGSVVQLTANEIGTDVFRGWYTPSGVKISDTLTQKITVNTNVKYVAKFGNVASVSTFTELGSTGESKAFVVASGVTSETSLPFTYGDKVTFSLSIKEGDYFKGWYLGGVLQPVYGESFSIFPDSAVLFSARLEDNLSLFYVMMTNESKGFGKLSMSHTHGELMTADSTWMTEVEQRFGTIDLLNNLYFMFDRVDTVSIESIKTVSDAIFKEFLLAPRMESGGAWLDGSWIPIHKDSQSAVVLTQDSTLKATYWSAIPTTITVAFVTGSDSSMGSIGFDRSGTNEVIGTSVSADFVQGIELFIVAMAKSGYKFTGWFNDEDGTDQIEDAIFEHRIIITTNPTTYYAKFSQDANAIYEWEGDGVNKRLHWESKCFVNPKPFNPSAATVDAEGYPVALTVKMSSSPDTSKVRNVSADILNQDGRRLPLARPEKYITVAVKSLSSINSVSVSTSMGGLRE